MARLTLLIAKTKGSQASMACVPTWKPSSRRAKPISPRSSTLRGPFFALGDEALLAFRQQINVDGSLTVRHLNPVRPIDRATLDPASAEVADGLELLRRLHVGRNSRPIAQSVTRLLQAVRAQAGIALWQNGEQALANCQRLVDMARHFERGASSFRAFVESIEQEAEHGEVNDAPIVEEGTEGVRVMTVYKAKGLEFPVVILADPTCPATREPPSRHIDAGRSLWLEPLCGATPIELRQASDLEMKRDRAEAVRVSYVAATRARDLVVVPTCGDGPIEGWFEVLNPVLYPPEDKRQCSRPAPGCPAFGEKSERSRRRWNHIPHHPQAKSAIPPTSAASSPAGASNRCRTKGSPVGPTRSSPRHPPATATESDRAPNAL
jgi:ATP-dependent helicase/nuclease subunit A